MGRSNKIKSRATIATNFIPPYACIFMDNVLADFLNSQETRTFVLLGCTDDIFFKWTHG